MAHYLKRFFGSSPDIDVLNYLRIELGGEVAQMDHLVLHPFGLTIVESKSVAGSIQIKDDGQWIRWFNKQPQGMRSPVTQATMQGMLLRDLLARTVKQKGFFDTVDLDVLVAISDSGTIQWPASGALPDVCKADQVPERILKKVEQRHRGGAPILTAGHRRVIGDFLRTIHRPLGAQPSGTGAVTPGGVSPAAESPAPVVESGEFKAPTASALPAKSCKHCSGTDVDIQHGKFGYYFRCKACDKNTPIRFACPTCGAEGRVRKQGKDFFAECRACDASAPFHSNA